MIYREDVYDPNFSNALYLVIKGSVELVYEGIVREGQALDGV